MSYMFRPDGSVPEYAPEPRRRAVPHLAKWLAGGVLAVAGVGFAADTFITNRADEGQAVPLIRADGFTDTSGVTETIGGGSINIAHLKVGQCLFEGGQANLSYRDGRVADVKDYQLEVFPGTPRETVVTVQNAAELSQAAPGLHC